MKLNNDVEKLMEDYEQIKKSLPIVDDKNVTHQYSDQELLQMSIVAITDLLNGMNISNRPKIEWLLGILEKRAKTSIGQ